MQSLPVGLMVVTILLVWSCGGTKGELAHDDTVRMDTIRADDDELTRVNLHLEEDTLDTETESYINATLRSVLGTSAVEFETDTAFEINRTMTQYLGSYDWNVFIAEGQFLPSTVQFRVFGAIKNSKASCFGLSSTPVGTRASLRYCDVSKERILIFGIDPAPHEELAGARVELLAAFHPGIFVDSYN